MKRIYTMLFFTAILISCKTTNRLTLKNEPMFTLEQIKAAHSKVKSGADFPQYIRDIIALGVTHYDTYVEDGHSDFSGINGYTISSPAKYDKLVISENCNAGQFMKDLKEHQEGVTDYPTFCRICADLGVNKWVVSTKEMTCIYYDQKGNEILVEQIPN